MAELRRLATKCGFDASLDETLRDRLVCGVISEVIERKLLTGGDLTITEVVEIAISMKAVQSNTQAMKPAALVGKVHTCNPTDLQRDPLESLATHSVDRPKSRACDSPPKSRDTRHCHQCGSISHQGSTCTH